MACYLCGNVEGFDHHSTPKPPCAVLRRSPCLGCLQLGDLDREILEVKSHLEALLSSRKALLTKINEEHDPIVRRLPLELTTHIFSLCNPFQPSLEVFSKFGGPGYNHKKTDESVPFILGAVCRTWRTIVSSTPHLWNVVATTFTDKSSPAKRDLLEQWLARSGNCPLFVRVVFLSSNLVDPPASAAVQLLTEILATLRQFSRRFSVFHLTVPPMNMSPLRDANPTSLPRATDAALDNIRVFVFGPYGQPLDELVVFDLGFVPAPRTLDISGIFWRNVKVDVTNITQLSVSRCAITDVAEVLQQIPRLRSLNLSSLIGDDIDLLTLQTINVVHHGLQNLDFSMERTIDVKFFDFISLPSLQTLSCDMNGEHLDELVSCLRRSKCSLKSIDLTDAYPVDEALFELLRLTPCLTRLRTVSTDITDAFLTKLGSTARIDNNIAPDQHFLPYLDTLVYHGDRSFEWSSILLLFPYAELLEQGGNFRHITEARFVIDTDYEDEGNPIDKKTVERILDLRKTVRISIVDIHESDLLLWSMKHHGILEDEKDEGPTLADDTVDA